MSYSPGEHPMRERGPVTRWLAVLALLAVLGLVWLVRSHDRSQPANATTSGSEFDLHALDLHALDLHARAEAQPLPAEALSDGGSRTEVADEAPQGGLLLEVLAPDGGAVHRAAVVPTRATARKFLLHDGTALALTDESGHARLTAGWMRAHAGEGLSLVANGFLPASLESAALEDGFERVTLSLGFELAVNCIDVAGSPVPDVTIALSLADLPFLTDGAATEWTPGPRAEEAIHLAISDAVGRATFRGLSPGRHGMRTWSAEHALIGGEPRALSLDVPGPEPTLRFGEFVAVVYRIEGDAVLGSKVIMWSAYEFTNYAEDALLRERAGLKRRFSDCVVVVGARKSAPPTEPLLVRAFFANWGIQEFELMPRPIGEIVEPTVLTPRSSPSGADARPELAECELVLLDASGNVCQVDGFSIDLEDPASVMSLAAKVESGRKLRLPPGNYRLRQLNPWVRANLADDAFRVPGVNVISLLADFRRCRVRIIGPSGAHGTGTQVKLATLAGDREIVIAGAEPLEVWIPVGACAVSARDATGQLEGLLEAQIEASSTGEAQELIVQLSADS